MEALDLVDESDQVIGRVPIDQAHKEGKLHREVHVWLYTPKAELIWQCRGASKPMFASLLDATVGGHVTSGQTYEEAAIRELAEETGVIADIKQLRFIKTIRSRIVDPRNGFINNVFLCVYALRYEGGLKDLKIEEGEISHFELWPIKKLFSLTEKEKQKFIPALLSERNLEIYKAIQKLV
ncbi:MAG TPA: NUDIX domain-containing protein [Candidatus Nitrosopolaris sp.]|nr:NUDIX domain-containing protein [Candidatus Nitrosopolaris sp.]